MKITEKESFVNKKFLTIEEGITREDIILEKFDEPTESRNAGVVHSRCYFSLKQDVVDRLYELFQFHTQYTDIFGLYVSKNRDTEVIRMRGVIDVEVSLGLQGVRKDKQQAKIDKLKDEVQALIDDEEYVNDKIKAALQEINSQLTKKVDYDNEQTLRDSLNRVRDTSLTKWTDSGSQTIASLKAEIDYHLNIISDLQEKIRQERSKKMEEHIQLESQLYDPKLVDEVQAMIDDDKVFSDTGLFGGGY